LLFAARRIAAARTDAHDRCRRAAARQGAGIGRPARPPNRCWPRLRGRMRLPARWPARPYRLNDALPGPPL
jgi:hypothetical protein